MIVLDANILIRAVLGSRILDLLVKYAGRVVSDQNSCCFFDSEVDTYNVVDGLFRSAEATPTDIR